MNETQRRQRIKRIRQYNVEMRGRGRPARLVNLDGAPDEVAAKVRAYVAQTGKTAIEMKQAADAVIGTDAQRDIGNHAQPSSLTFGVKTSTRTKYHAVIDAGTQALCGKDVGDWDPEGDLTQPWNQVLPDDQCGHCGGLMLRNANRA